jgi:hypothetical protein
MNNELTNEQAEELAGMVKAECRHEGEKRVGYDEVTCRDCGWITPSGQHMGPHNGWFPSHDAHKQFKKYGTYPGMDEARSINRNAAPTPPSAHVQQSVQILNDDELCELAEKFGANVEWAKEPDEFHHIIKLTPPELRAVVESISAPVQQSVQWQPIDAAPKDNKRPLLMARFVNGELCAVDFNGRWEFFDDGGEDHHIQSGYAWTTEQDIGEPTHWAYQDGPCDLIASASPAGDKVEVEPVAWAVFADSGSLELWLCKMVDGLVTPVCGPEKIPAEWMAAIMRERNPK